MAQSGRQKERAHSSSAPVSHPSDWPAVGKLALERLRNQGTYEDPCGLRIHLARTFGFCQGVERAVARAMQAARELHAAQTRDPLSGTLAPPGLFMMGEIIHNPSTNRRLGEAGVIILPPPGTPGRLSVLRPTDWVIIPAFGITVLEEAKLREIGCRIIDTTCGWVRRIWSTVRDFSREGLTTVVHGKVEHEETRATASRIEGPYVIVRNREEAELLAAAVRRDPIPETAAAQDTPTHADMEQTPAPSSRLDWFQATFSGRCSPGFDPQRHLDRLGLINQTTMLSSETQAIAGILERAVGARSGLTSTAGCFRTLDTFCPATQKRQNAVRELLQSTEGLDMMIVVGGFRSSNTAHLVRLASERVATLHVEDPSCLISSQEIRHLPLGTREPAIARGWKPQPPCTIGVTAGASTPEHATDGTVLRLLAFYRGEDA